MDPTPGLRLLDYTLTEFLDDNNALAVAPRTCRIKVNDPTRRRSYLPRAVNQASNLRASDARYFGKFFFPSGTPSMNPHGLELRIIILYYCRHRRLSSHRLVASFLGKSGVVPGVFCDRGWRIPADRTMHWYILNKLTGAARLKRIFSY